MLKELVINLVVIIVIALAIAVLLGIVLSKFKIPVLIGYIITGVCISYLFNFNAQSAESLRQIAEYGIVFLMFMIGIEFSFKKMKTMKQEVLLFGGLQMGLTAAFFYVVCQYIIGFNPATSIIIACAISLSSTAIVLKQIKEMRQIKTAYGNCSVGILIAQDIAVIPILLMIAMLSNEKLELSSLILHTLGAIALLLIVLFLPGKWIAQNILKFTAGMKTDEIFVATVLLIVLAAASISQYFGFSSSLGAFLVGMIIANTPYRYQVQAVLVNFRDLLLGVFFVTVGMQVNLLFLGKYFLAVLVILCFVMLSKTLLIYLFLCIFRTSKVALKTALSLSQIGEFSFAIFLIAVKNKVLDLHFEGGLIQSIFGSKLSGISGDDIYQFLTLLVIFSMIATPFILEKIDVIVDLILRKSKDKTDSESADDTTNQKFSDNLSDHVLVCGYGDIGKEVVKNLRATGIKYVAIDKDPRKVEEGLLIGDNVIYGNVTNKSIFRQLNTQDAMAAIIAIDNFDEIKNVTECVTEISNTCKVITRLTEQLKKEGISQLDFYAVVDEQEEIGKLLADIVIKQKSNEESSTKTAKQQTEAK